MTKRLLALVVLVFIFFAYGRADEIGVCDTIRLSWRVDEWRAEKQFAIGLSGGGGFWVDFGDGHARHEYYLTDECPDTVLTVAYEVESSTPYVEVPVLISVDNPETRIMRFNCGMEFIDENGNIDLWGTENEVTELDISACTTLEKLCCGFNNLEFLDMSENRNLIYLDCRDNELKALDISRLERLTYLDCGYNDLDTLEVSENVNLRYLYCGGSHIVSLDVSSCPALKELDCYNNWDLTSLDVSGCTALEKMYVGAYPFISLDLRHCVSMKALHVEIYGGTLDVSGCTALEALTAWYLSSLDVSGCTALETLVCQGAAYNHREAGLSSLDVSDCMALKHFDCSENCLATLDVSGCGFLTYLNCGGNALPLSILAGIPDGIDTCFILDQFIFDTLSAGDTLDWRSEMMFDGVATRVDFGSVPSTAYTFGDGCLVFLHPGQYDICMRHDSIESSHGRQTSVCHNITVVGDTIAPTGSTSSEVLISAGDMPRFRAYVRGRIIYLATEGELGEVSVYTSGGQQIYRGCATAIPVSQSGVYIVSVGNRRQKVLVR